MKKLVVLFYFFYNVFCDDVARILDYKFEKDNNGPYNFKFSTSDGYEREETAELLHEGTEYESILLHGSYQYQGADGKIYTIKYRADDNGFHPEGDHFEVPPYVPWPSNIDVRTIEKNQETEGSRPSSSNSLRFLTTQRPPKLPNKFLSTPKPNSVTVLGSFSSPTNLPEITKEYIPTSSISPLDKGDVVGSPTRKSSKIVLSITKEYVPTSPLPPITKGDIIGSSTAANNKIETFTKNPLKNKFIPGVTNIYIPSSTELPAKGNFILDNELGPKITYEGRPSDNFEKNDADFIVLTPKGSLEFGARIPKATTQKNSFIEKTERSISRKQRRLAFRS